MLKFKESLLVLFGLSLFAVGLYGLSAALWFTFTTPFAWYSIANIAVGVVGGFTLMGLGSCIGSFDS